MNPKQPKVTVKLSEIDPEPVEVLAASILSISQAMTVIRQSRLNRKALVALIQHNSKLPMRTIEIVLNNLQDLERDWLKPAIGGAS